MSNIRDWDREHLWHFRAYPTRIIDGDTFVAMCDQGMWGRAEVHIRVADLLKPELSDFETGQAAFNAMADAVYGYDEACDPRKWRLRVISRQRETITTEVRSFERFVCDVYVVQEWDGEMVNLLDILFREYGMRGLPWRSQKSP